MDVSNTCVACGKEVDIDNCVIVVVGGNPGALHNECYISVVVSELMNIGEMMDVPTGTVAH